MAKEIFTLDDDDLLEQLGIKIEPDNIAIHTPREERIIAGFEDIQRFFENYGRLPKSGDNVDIFERIYAVRLETIQNSEECKMLLKDFDKHGLLESVKFAYDKDDDIDDDALLSELGINIEVTNDITHLTHVKPRAEMRILEEIAQRSVCHDFDIFKPLFLKVQEELKNGTRKTREFKDNAIIKLGEFFILGGQKAYIAEVGDEIKTAGGDTNARLRVIYDNGTESNLLRRSLQSALYKDSAGRRITEPTIGPLFSGEHDESDTQSGTIYVLRSDCDNPYVKEHRNIIHKIGVTSGDVKKRIVNAKDAPTFLMADVEIIATYKLSNINRSKLENLIHKFFETAKLDIEIMDRFGKPIIPREWFLVPLFIIDAVVEKIKDKTLMNYRYCSDTVSLIEMVG